MLLKSECLVSLLVKDEDVNVIFAKITNEKIVD